MYECFQDIRNDRERRHRQLDAIRDLQTLIAEADRDRLAFMAQVEMFREYEGSCMLSIAGG